MKDTQTRVVKDFWHGLKVFGATCAYGFILLALFLFVMKDNTSSRIGEYIFFTILLLTPMLAIVGFIINYIPLKVKNGIVYIPASDQIRTFLDLITINPITGLYRRRSYSVNDIENVANGYTKVKQGQERSWNVVITGVKDAKSFSQRINCHNKQVRDEVRNVLKHTISGRVNSDFAI
jgi:hypothetical protein